MLSFKLIDGGF